MSDDKEIIYVSPKPEVLEHYAQRVCQAMTERGQLDCSDPEISAGLAFFLRVLFGIRAKELNGEL